MVSAAAVAGVLAAVPAVAHRPPAATSGAAPEVLVAEGGTVLVGAGRPVRYRVEVEGGTADPDTFARAVEEVLADPSGWATQGDWAFQRASAGQADFAVRLGAGGIDAERWAAGTPEFRRFLINCEVSRQLGAVRGRLPAPAR